MIRANDIIEKVADYYPAADFDTIRKAYAYSAYAHRNQVRLSGEPYMIHPIEVASMLADMKMDVASIAAGLLHDTLEDDPLTSVEELSLRFGDEITSLIEGLTKISKIKFKSSREHQAENYRKMILAMVKDIRVLIIKLVDRIHNMRTLEFQKPVRQEIIAQETLDIYAPLANRLGISWMKLELEDLSLRYLQPEIYRELEEKVARKELESRDFIDRVIKLLQRNLDYHGIQSQVSGRLKHLFGIYRKMVQRNIAFEQIYDIIAFRVLVDDKAECYNVLGIIHSLWRPVPSRFKDFISMPKANMYQSLHTTVIGPEGRHVEFQIRTHEMHQIAEMGIAAHWHYKEGYQLEDQDRKQMDWLRQMIEWQQDVNNPGEFLDSVKIDLFSEAVYVFTPAGEVKELPSGSTPIDLAYSIHSNLGDQCSGAKVNGKLVPLRYQLRNGEMVEIVTSKRQHPSKDWLAFVKTGKARAKIKQWIKKEEERRSIELGRELCEKAFSRVKLSLNQAMKSGRLQAVAAEFSLGHAEGLLAAVGRGKISAKQVANRIFPDLRDKPEPKGKKAETENEKKNVRDGISIKDIDDVMVRFAKCCNPLPGDDVVGFITRGRGLTIHRRNCRHVHQGDSERYMEVDWNLERASYHSVKIRIMCEDIKGMLVALGTAISSQEANIASGSLKTSIDQKAICLFEVKVRDLEHLKKVKQALRAVKGVYQVVRIS
ncbi:MAG: bifunctional (p)ppGpp synthetase/guanosine-3',5'-bis(diphosphate) 3'-pyrophosphohydrolase [Deltaproteobacteria bacterium]|nr:bifunctional (p)ppGpp synthetase/guanosine-3',5'-bis(diphosphate) 3'-pyrophosphohydrolase [Deltaproteobacteria bacterium]